MQLRRRCTNVRKVIFGRQNVASWLSLCSIDRKYVLSSELGGIFFCFKSPLFFCHVSRIVPSEDEDLEAPAGEWKQAKSLITQSDYSSEQLTATERRVLLRLNSCWMKEVLRGKQGGRGRRMEVGRKITHGGEGDACVECPIYTKPLNIAAEGHNGDDSLRPVERQL